MIKVCSSGSVVMDEEGQLSDKSGYLHLIDVTVMSSIVLKDEIDCKGT